MVKRMLIPALFGLAGGALLLWLGFWQLQRLQWKESYLAAIEARIHDAPAALPARPDPEADRFLPVRVAGRIEGPEIHVLASSRKSGPAYRVITAFITDDGRRVLLDRGMIPTGAAAAPRPPRRLVVTGNLHWPQETGSGIPAPDLKANIWFARDVPAMARALGTEPVLIVAASDTGDGVVPFPVSTEGIPNNHLSYAVQWFGMAAVWFGMTLFLLWRIKRRTEQETA